MKTDLLDIRLADCMDVMREYPDKHFDLAIVDPPYGIGFSGHDQIIGKSGKGRGFAAGPLYAKKTWDEDRPSEEFFVALQRVSKNQIVWGGNYMANSLPISKGWIYWDKVPNGDSLTFSDGELAWSSFDLPLRGFRYAWIGFGMVNSGEKKIHPTQKPVALYRWLLSKYSERGQRILDTHLGSGSSAIACHYARCPLVACEIDPDYYAAACARIERETAVVEFDFEQEPPLLNSFRN